MGCCSARAGATEKCSSRFSRQRCSNVHKSRGHFPTVTWECVRMETPFKVWACLRVAEQNVYKRCDVPEVLGQKSETTCICLCRCACVVSREEEKGGGGGWRLQYSSLHRFSGPAWGCGKCQPLIELIKPFWVSDVNMVSTTKGHCIRQLPLGGPWGIKGLFAVCLHARAGMYSEFLSRAALVVRWKQGKANDWRRIKGFFCCELIWINSFLFGQRGWKWRTCARETGRGHIH